MWGISVVYPHNVPLWCEFQPHISTYMSTSVPWWTSVYTVMVLYMATEMVWYSSIYRRFGLFFFIWRVTTTFQESVMHWQVSLNALYLLDMTSSNSVACSQRVEISYTYCQFQAPFHSEVFRGLDSLHHRKLAVFCRWLSESSGELYHKLS